MKIMFAYTLDQFGKEVLDNFTNLVRIFGDHEIVPTSEGIFEEQYDLGISFLYVKKVPKKELDKSPWINFHPGPLPEYGGRNLGYHAVLDGAKTFGATAHYMDEHFDTGPRIWIEYFNIEDDMTAYDITQKSKQCLYYMLIALITDILTVGLPDRQDHKPIRYFCKENIDNEITVTDEQVKQIRARYCPPHFPIIKIGNKTFKIIEDTYEYFILPSHELKPR